MKYEDILSMSWDEISRLNNEELRSVSTVLNSVANKRLKRMRSHESTKHSIGIKGVRKFKLTKTNNRNKQLQQFKRVRSFLKRKTSTAKGWKEFQNKTAERFSEVNLDYKGLTKKQKKQFWDLYHRYTETSEGLALTYNVGSDKTQYELLYNMVKLHMDGDWNSLFNKLNTDLDLINKYGM